MTERSRILTEAADSVQQHVRCQTHTEANGKANAVDHLRQLAAEALPATGNPSVITNRVLSEVLAERDEEDTSDDACWEWTGTRDSDGYGLRTVNGRQWRVHRFAYMEATGEDPGALHVLHSCDNPPCYRPSHLRLGTNADNVRDKVERGRARNQYVGAEACIYGHQFTPGNTYVNPASGNRQCRTCRRLSNALDRKLAKAPKATRTVLREVFRERLRQDFVFGWQNHNDGTGGIESRQLRDEAQKTCQAAAERGIVTWAHIADEEHCEALAETDPVRLRAELVQAAAVYVAWIEAIDRRTVAATAEEAAGTAAPAPAVAPLAASQPSEASVEGETATRASTGRVGDSGAEVVERDAIHLHFGLTYANYLVLPRTLLQSMDDEWQTGFVAHLDRLNEAFAHVPQAKGYKVEAATEHEVADLDEQQLAQLGITEDWCRGETPPEGLSPEDLAEWEAEHEDPEGPTYSRDGEELDPHQRVLIPCEDPVPHYRRGRTRIAPKTPATPKHEIWSAHCDAGCCR